MDSDIKNMKIETHKKTVLQWYRDEVPMLCTSEEYGMLKEIARGDVMEAAQTWAAWRKDPYLLGGDDDE